MKLTFAQEVLSVLGGIVEGLWRTAGDQADFLADLIEVEKPKRPGRKRIKGPSSKIMVRIHANKREIKRGRRGRPWTVHTSKACIPAKEVQFRSTRCGTEFKPDLPSNPKAFVT